MFPVGGLIKKAKAMIPKSVTAAAKTVVKKVADSATKIINRFEKNTSAATKALASIPAKVNATAKKAQAITQKVAAAVPKVIDAAKAAGKKQLGKIAEVNNVIKTSILTKAVEINSKNLRILDAVKTESNTAVTRIIKGSITLGAMPGYNATRNSAAVLNFLLQTRNAIIKEYPILNLQHSILKTSLSFIEDQAKNLNDYVGSVASQANAPFISDYLVSLTGHRDPNAKSNGPSIQGAYDRGLYIKGMGGTIDAIANILADPYEALEGLNTIAMEPEIMVPAIAKIMIKHVDTKVIHGSAEDRVEFTSQAIFEVAQLFIGTGEIKLGTKVVALGKETLKAVEVIKYATKADKIIQIEKLLNSTIFKTLEKTLNATAKSAGGKAVDCIESLRIILRNNSKSLLPSYAGIGVIDNFVETSEMVQKYITKFKNMASDITNGKGVNIEIKSNIKGIEEGTENAVKAFGEGSGKSIYDIEGSYTGGRTSTELDSLAKDPAHTGSNRQIDIEKGIHERTVGLNVEESGKIKGPIVRDPSGKAEFFDANGQAWDVKSFNSNFKPKKGGYTLESSLRSINKSLSEDEFVILDTSNLSPLHKAELLDKLSDLNLMDKIVTWP